MSESSAPPGWYPVDGGTLRYWDGAAWTDHVSEAQSSPVPARTGKISEMASNVTRGLTSNEHEVPEGTIWHAIGKGVGGITTGRYRLDIHYLYVAKGALRTDSQQVPIAEVVDVDVRQSLTQKARNVWSVVVHVNGATFRQTVTLDDIADGATAQRVINQTARDARLMLEHRTIHMDGLRHQATNTVRQEISYEGLHPGVSHAPGTGHGQPGTPPVPRAAEPEISVEVVDASAEPVVDPIDQLKKLAELRDAGILTEDEFAAKKADILSRM